MSGVRGAWRSHGDVVDPPPTLPWKEVAVSVSAFSSREPAAAIQADDFARDVRCLKDQEPHEPGGILGSARAPQGNARFVRGDLSRIRSVGPGDDARRDCIDAHLRSKVAGEIVDHL